ncbi:MAG: hypothetical protein D6692_10740 [Planctomycetota bacterium]|nr:MAG: hypothetical protein D6692_10740 [Planctomycetota bacterium]
MIRQVWTIAAREIASLFRLPVGWIVVALYAFLSALVFVQYALIPGSPATMRYFFAAAAWMMVPVAPAISMRLLAEEARSGTIEMLRTAPVDDGAVALGKFLGAWLFLGITLAPTLVLPITLALVSDPMPDPGPVVTGYLSLILFGGLCLGVGLVASALTSSQTLAFLGTLMTLVLVLLLGGPIASTLGPGIGERLRSVSVMGRVTELAKGVFDSGAIAFFLIAMVWSVVLTAGVLESRRLSRPRTVRVTLWAAFIAGTGASAVLAGVLSQTHRIRADVTSTGAHRLSPRAERMVDLLDGPTEIVFALDRSRADQRAADLVGDVLAAYERASPFITVRSIDLSGLAGLEQTDDLLRTLAERESETINRAIDAAKANAATMRAVATDLETLARALDAVRDAIGPSETGAQTNRAFFDQRAGLARGGARSLAEQADALEAGLNEPAESNGLPPIDRLTPPAISIWRTQRTQLADLAEQAAAFAGSDIVSPNAASLARAAAQRAGDLRDRAAIAQEQLERLPRIDALRVARALETGEALLVIGPTGTGVSAVDLDALLPPTEVLERAGVSAAGFIGPRAQELIASAIGRLIRPERPIVVFTHAGRPGEFLGGNYVTKVVERFARQGIDCLEWAAVEQIDPPDLSGIDPARTRPVVYLVISYDSTQGTTQGGLTGTQRAEQLAAAVKRLTDAGEPVLLSLNPSIFPTYGGVDPLAALAEPYGIIARTGTPLLRERVGPGGRVANPIISVVPAGGDHPLADAMRGMSTVLPWAVPITVQNRADATAWPVITATGDDAEGLWAESEWLRLWKTPADGRPYMPDQPGFDAEKDEKNGSWVLAAAGQRTGRFGESRMIVVGSNTWATDGVVVGVEQMVDGRVVTRFPGNGTLLDTAVLWLAGLDELIAPGADARSIATIQPLTPSQLTTLRWVLLGVVPGVILLGGAGFRAWRG